jgi:sarcosine oxidase subunit gamma
MLERQSALASVLGLGGRDGADGRRRCRIGEVRGWSLVQVAGFASTLLEVEERLEATVGELPLGSRNVVAGERTIFRTAPEQFWIVGPDDDLVERLTRTIGPEIGAVTDLSHSRTRIFIEGDCAPEIMRKGVPLDFHPEVFTPGQAALTGLHHTPVLIHRISTMRFEIYAMRSFALSVWEWLTDAALEFGYDVDLEAA